MGSNRTFFNTYALASANFKPQYPYIFSPLQSREALPQPVLSQINLRAQQYHSDLTNGVVQPSYIGETTSRWGVQNVCIYTHNDVTAVLTCSGVRQWINATNSARSAAGAASSELIVVEQDVLWNIDTNTIDQTLYTSTMNQCSDHVDIMIVCGVSSYADNVAVTAALAATEVS